MRVIKERGFLFGLVFSITGAIAKIGGKSLVKERNFRAAIKTFIKAAENDFEANRALKERKTKKVEIGLRNESVEDIVGLGIHYLEPEGVVTYDQFRQFHTLTMDQNRLVVTTRGSNDCPTELYPDELLPGIGPKESLRTTPGFVNYVGGCLQLTKDGNIAPVITDAIETAGISVRSLAVGIGTVVAAFEMYDLVNKMNEKNSWVEFMSKIAAEVEQNLQCYPGLLESV